MREWEGENGICGERDLGARNERGIRLAEQKLVTGNILFKNHDGTKYTWTFQKMLEDK